MSRPKSSPRFSIGWFFSFMILNIVGSVLLALIGFFTAMSAFSSSSNIVVNKMAAIEGFCWIWTTGTMVASKYFGMTVERGLFGVTILWAFVVGTVAGFLMPRLVRQSTDRPLTCIEAPPPEKW